MGTNKYYMLCADKRSHLHNYM